MMSQTMTNDSGNSNVIKKLLYRRQLALVFIGGLSVSVFLGFMAYGWEKNSVEANFELVAASYEAAVRHEIGLHMEMLDSTGALLDTTPDLTQNEYATFVERHLDYHIDIDSVIWLPRITADRRGEFEKQRQPLNHHNFLITEQDDEGQLIPAARRAEYFPAMYIEPIHMHADYFGLDFAADPRFRNAMEQARDTGQLTASPPMYLDANKATQPIETIFRPVYDKNKNAITLMERQKNLIGFIAGTLRIDNLVADAFSGMPEQLVNIRILGDTGSGSPEMIYQHSAPVEQTATPGNRVYGLFSGQENFDLHTDITVPLQNQLWHIHFTPTAEFFRKQSTWRHISAFTAGLLLTMFVVLYLWKSRRDEQELHALASDLLESNDELQSEINEKQHITAILSDVADTVMARTGESFYHMLVVQLCQTLDVEYAFIGVYTDENKTQLSTIAFCAEGVLKENFCFNVFNTPCANISKEEISLYQDNFQEKFPDCSIIHNIHAESYAGMPMLDNDNEIIGLIAIMSAHQMEKTAAARSVLKIFANRASAELEHSRKIRKIQELAKFHDENPNPVIRVSHDGRLLYANKIAMPLLEYWRTGINGILPDIIQQQCNLCRESGQPVEYEATCNEQIYSLQFNPIHNTGYINIYGRDITDHAQAKATLVERESQLRTMIETAPETIVVFDATDNMFVDFNRNAIDQFGHNKKQLQELSLLDLTPLNQPNGESSAAMLSRFIEETLSNKPTIFEWVFLDAGQREILCEVRMARLPSSEKKLIRASIIDQSWRIKTEAQIRKMSQVAEHTDDSVVITDQHGCIEYVNPSFERMTGYSSSEAVGEKLNIIKSDQHDDTYYENLWQTILKGKVFHGIMINRRKNGTLYYEEKTITPLKDVHNRIINFISTGKDITNRMETELRLHQLTNNDLLTDLPNRSSLLDNLSHLLQKRDAHDHRHALLCLGLDRFKNVNETLGHDVGDELLRSFALRLKGMLRGEDILARFSGDEFAILVEDIGGERDVAKIAEKLIAALADPFVIKKHELFVSASIGASLFPDDGQDPKTLIKHAEMAMYRAKESGRNTFGFYSAEMSNRAVKRLQLETSLRRAIEHNEFLIYYQPQIDMRSRQICGAEALLRWQNPEHGLISPMEFIPLLEDTGLIVEVGEWLIQTACHQAKLWQENFDDSLRISINLSGRQFYSPNLSSVISDTLRQSGLNPGTLELEITESVLMQDNITTVDNLHNLRKLGTRLAIDDFGTGYSSLSYLQRFPVDTLKVDRSFIINLSASTENRNIVSAIISMAHSLSLDVVAEGVETVDQLNILRELRCNQIQGYLFSPPVRHEEITEFLQSKKSLDAA